MVNIKYPPNEKFHEAILRLPHGQELEGSIKYPEFEWRTTTPAPRVAVSRVIEIREGDPSWNRFYNGEFLYRVAGVIEHGKNTLEALAGVMFDYIFLPLEQYMDPYLPLKATEGRHPVQWAFAPDTQPNCQYIAFLMAYATVNTYGFKGGIYHYTLTTGTFHFAPYVRTDEGVKILPYGLRNWLDPNIAKEIFEQRSKRVINSGFIEYINLF